MKKIISLILLITFMNINTAWAEIGNDINPEEYPEGSAVAPFVSEPQKADTTDTISADDALVIEGSVEKSIDITLDDCIRLALGNNPKIQMALQDVFASNARIKQAWSAYFPKVSWQTGYTRMKQLQLSDALGRNLTFDYYLLGQVTLSEMLYDFGVTQNKVTIQKLNSQGYKIALTATINSVLCDVKKSYYNLLYAYEKVKVAEEAVENFELFYDQAKAFYTAGLKPKVDVTIAEVNLSNAKLHLIQAENNIDIAIAQLNNTLGLPYINRYNVQEKLKYSPCDITLNDSVEIAKESRPEFRLADVKVEAALQNVKLTKKSYFPSLSIEGQYQIGGRHFTSNTGYNFGGYLTFPTVNGMLINNQIKEAKALHNKEMANADYTKNSIILEIQNAFYSLKEKKNQLPVAFLTVKKAKENYELSYGRYRVGVGNPTELKDAQVTYENALLNFYASLFEYNQAKANLEKAVGKNIVNGTIEKDYIFEDDLLYNFAYSDILHEFEQTDETVEPKNNTIRENEFCEPENNPKELVK